MGYIGLTLAQTLRGQGIHVWGLGKMGLKQLLTWLCHVLLPLMTQFPLLGSTTMGHYNVLNSTPSERLKNQRIEML